MYLAGYAKTTLEDTVIELTTNNGSTESPIEIAAGELVIKSGSFTGVFTNNSIPSVKGSITSEGGCGIYIKQHTTLLPIEVTIKGGSFVVGIAVSEQINTGVAESQRRTDLINITITGGTFDSQLSKEGVETKAVSVESDDATLTITGGTFIENGVDVTSKYVK